jgi:hypothetical protein
MAADDEHEKQGMSQGVATIYRVLFDELKFAKTQQWKITYYLLLVLAAIFGIGKALELKVWEKILGSAFVVVLVGFGLEILRDLQRYMEKCRNRLADIEREDSKCFTLEERKFLKLEPEQSAFTRGLAIVVLLALTSVFGGLIVVWSLWRSLICP